MQTIDFWGHGGGNATSVRGEGASWRTLSTGGENIYPREIEEYLYRHPNISDVQVFGVPDVKFVEELCAWIILKPDTSCSEEEIREFCRGQIAHYKIPRYIRFVKEYPMTITGKVQKFAMRDKMIEELDLNQAKTA